MIIVREMSDVDLSQVAGLVAQLGYDCTESEVVERFRYIQASVGHKLFVATDDQSKKVVGWIHILQFPTLEMSISTELGGLVVDSSMRGRGIGKALVLAAEEWSLKKGITRLQFTSQMKRVEAHTFYKKLGYKIIKNSYYFSKDLARV
jgi:GNAT superfamily N-acetyltransferase